MDTTEDQILPTPDELEVLNYDELLPRFVWDYETSDYLSLTMEI